MGARTEAIRQGRFEAVVGLMLQSLETIFTESVQVEPAPWLSTPESGELELAFELTYTLAEQPHRWLIECERPSSSQKASDEADSREAAERLLAVRSSRPEDRLIFLYRFENPLDEALCETLEAAGIDHYSLKEFGIRLDEVNITLAEDTGLDKALYRLELMKSSRRFPALRAAFSKMRVKE